MRIAIIPARGGSKRIPKKNIKEFCGKPMIAWPIDAANSSGCFDRIVVSTDNEEIARVAEKYGAEVPFIRPVNLSDDHTTVAPVIDHAIKLLGTIKDCLDYSSNFRSLFGYWGQYSAKQWSKSEIELKDGSMIICKGTGQQLRGIKHGNQRPTLIILDDPEDENNTKV